MAASSQEERRGRNPAASLTDDLIVEILSRLPPRSVCRSRCVSKHWRALISHPDHRKKLPQTLAGFFCHTYSRERFPESAHHFTNAAGNGPPLIRPSLSFLPGYGDVTVLDSCNGVLLCRGRTAGASSYVVCNPATEEWAELPESGQGGGDIFNARLGFDPAACPHFHVFEFVETDVDPENGDVFVDGLEIYSSRTGEWAHSDVDGVTIRACPMISAPYFSMASSVCLHMSIKMYWWLIRRGRRGGPLPCRMATTMVSLANLKGAYTI